MAQQLHSVGKGLGICLVLLVLHVLPARAQTAGITFRNDLPTPIFVQGASYVGGVARRGEQLRILPGRTALDANVPMGTRYILILDANQPGRPPLLREAVPFNGLDLSFSVRRLPNGLIRLVPE